MKDQKQLARDFLKLVIADKIDEAYQKYVDMKGKHHNVFFLAGFSELQKAMKDNGLQFPNKIFEIKNILSDNDLVAVHSHLRFKPEDKGMITIHLFRFKNNKIIEMWDCGQIIPEHSPNKDCPF